VGGEATFSCTGTCTLGSDTGTTEGGSSLTNCGMGTLGGCTGTCGEGPGAGRGGGAARVECEGGTEESSTTSTGVGGGLMARRRMSAIFA
jgi:hypothetical protein